MSENLNIDAYAKTFGFSSPEKLNHEEGALLCCFLRDPDLISANSKIIKDFQFTETRHAIMYKCMVNIIERGGKTLPVEEIAMRMRELDSSMIEKDQIQYMNALIHSSKEPDFFKSANRFWENYKLRKIHWKFKEVLELNKDENGDSKEVVDRLENLLMLRKEPNPFAGSCKTAKEALVSTFTMLHSIWDGIAEFPKVRTGYPEIDQITDNGFDEGAFAVIGAATGHGKTAISINLAASMAKVGNKTVFISLEESYRDVTLKLIMSQSGVPRKHLVNRNLITEQEQRKAHQVMEHFSTDENLLQFACGSKTGAEVLSLIRSHHQRDGSRVFIIDYVQRIRMETENRTAEIARFVMALGELCKELGILIIGTSQLRREGRREMAKRKPTGFDLSESAFIENEASYIITLFRQDEIVRMFPDFEDSDDFNSDDEGTVEFIVCKSRNGMTGSVKLWFKAECTKMSSRLGEFVESTE